MPTDAAAALAVDAAAADAAAADAIAIEPVAVRPVSIAALIRQDLEAVSEADVRARPVIIRELASGATIACAALAAGIHPSTVCRLAQEDEDVGAALAAGHALRMNTLGGTLLDAGEAAVHALKNIAGSVEIAADHRIQAATEILDRIGITRQAEGAGDRGDRGGFFGTAVEVDFRDRLARVTLGRQA